MTQEKIRSISDKRNESRLITLSPLRIKIQHQNEGHIEIIKAVNISRDGISVITNHPLPIKSRVSLRFEPPSLISSPLESFAIVRRCEQLTSESDGGLRYVCGLSLDMIPEAKQSWDEFLNEVLRDGSAAFDRRSASRLLNGLTFNNPVKKGAHKYSRENHFIQIQQLGPKDLDDLQIVEIEAWGKEMCATREMLNSRQEVFPEGMIGARLDGKLIGYVAMMMINQKNLEKDFTWRGITNDGHIKETHNPKGDCLYGISLSVIPDAPKNVSLLLIKAGGKLTIRKALKGIFFGARMPNYHKHHKKYSAEEYVKATSKTGRILDPELAIYRQVNCLPIRVLPNYFQDPESLNFGVLVSWLNPFYEIQNGEYPFFFNKVTVDFT